MNKPSSRLIYCTTREAAVMLGISLRTAQLWVDSGALEAWRTEGGHRRITIRSVEKLRRTNPPSIPLTTQSTDKELPFPPLRILIAEADNALIRLYKARLKSWELPITVITTSNTYEALLLIGRESPDLMIIDLELPGMNAYQMLRTLISSSYREGLEIAVLSGESERTIGKQDEIPASVRVFKKPVPFDELRLLTEQMLARRAAL
jgi:excisionase family DNA binding protein